MRDNIRNHVKKVFSLKFEANFNQVYYSAIDIFFARVKTVLKCEKSLNTLPNVSR